MHLLAYDQAVSDVRQNPAVTLLSLARLSPAEILLSQSPLDCELLLFCYLVAALEFVVDSRPIQSVSPVLLSLFSHAGCSSATLHCRIAVFVKPTVLPPSSSIYSNTDSVCAKPKTGSQTLQSKTSPRIRYFSSSPGRCILCGGGKSCSVASRRGREFLLAHC